ncbi:hypothetical protein FXN63_10430 [Pigmentiphaga aceris]|uniref:Lipoprotein n=1 Tax=Pigmentiphaga aceris TaxID=1940612 RepID=A0A5C0AV37_9BURK|nr:hypothetical protein [Pigmentiphaga aceris]QEI06208.1 hypothetical protein FXN63_10430 [Pigmentiphaga aceris]
MSFLRPLLSVLAVVILAGCAAKPQLTGESAMQPKQLSFPAVDAPAVAAKGGVVHLRANYLGSYTYRLRDTLSVGFMLGRLSVTSANELLEAELQGERMYCTQQRVFSAMLEGPSKHACFGRGPTDGVFNRVRVAPGEYWFTKDLPQGVPYVSTERGVSVDGSPLKREIYFEGSENGVVLFTVKTYDQSLDGQARMRPIMLPVPTLPATVDVDGAQILIEKVTPNALTYRLKKGFL